MAATGVTLSDAFPLTIEVGNHTSRFLGYVERYPGRVVDKHFHMLKVLAGHKDGEVSSLQVVYRAVDTSRHTQDGKCHHYGQRQTETEGAPIGSVTTSSHRN